MAKFNFKRRKTKLDEEIDRVINEMSEASIYDDNYEKLQAKLDKLLCAKAKKEPRQEKINPNTVLVLIGGTIQMLTVLDYERLHVITGKAWNFIAKPRL